MRDGRSCFPIWAADAVDKQKKKIFDYKYSEVYIYCTARGYIGD